MLILDFHHSVATVHRWYFKQVVLVELQARCIEVDIRRQWRDFYRRYFTGLVLAELLESPIYARLRRKATIVGLPEHAVWDYYLEEILPAVSNDEDYDRPLEYSVEVQSPPLVDWNFIDLVEGGESWAEIQRNRSTYSLQAELLEEHPDFMES